MRMMDTYYFSLLVLVVLNFRTNFGDVIVSKTVKVVLNGFSISEFISSHGYPVEVHENIQTEDGYLLDIIRIPFGKPAVDVSSGPKPVAFLMHGFLGTAENWVITGPGRGLAFLLADRGYDVWMGNARGSTHSRKHVSLTSDCREFWQFSWHEIGIYDLPAKITYILQHTQQTQLTYIGHSQGNTAFFVMASERVTFNANIKLMVAMGPVGYMSHIPHPGIRPLLFNRGATINRLVQFWTNVIGPGEFTPNADLLNLAGQALCKKQSAIQELCANILFLGSGYDSRQLERSLLPIIVQTMPAGASSKQLFHYAQEIASGKFCKYDYGVLNNMIVYGSPLPPSYNLSRVTAPVALFYSKNDWLVSAMDVKRLSRELPNVVLEYIVPYPAFNHLDYLLAKDVVTLVYTKVFEIMQKFV